MDPWSYKARANRIFSYSGGFKKKRIVKGISKILSLHIIKNGVVIYKTEEEQACRTQVTMKYLSDIYIKMSSTY